MLKISNLVVSYGGIEALKGIDLNVEKGKIVTLVGANGAGKSTVLRSIVGLVKKKDGNIEYKGKDLSGIKTQNLSSMGLTLVPEGRRIFSDLTVEENLNIAGSIVPSRFACNPPPTPAKKAHITKAKVLCLNKLIPILSAATSSSLIDFNALP